MKKVTASKTHHCSVCRKAILPGRNYYTDSKKDNEGKYVTTKYCMQHGQAK